MPKKRSEYVMNRGSMGASPTGLHIIELLAAFELLPKCHSVDEQVNGKESFFSNRYFE